MESAMRPKNSISCEGSVRDFCRLMVNPKFSSKKIRQSVCC